MTYSVSEFVTTHGAEINTFRGYKTLLEDMTAQGNKRSHFTINNDMLAKKLLSNDYGHVCDNKLCMAFKKFVSCRQTAREDYESTPVTM